ncbi:metal-dependent hydrolase [Amaricoccus sp.]|uniref:metal-dependent hydrolase n=1 Tax=Amaricoccus sp. TaxID=1872485 RepID=UPI001B65C38A|nr:metal-dependent hydrolase [Amaricoccus sp.]MBP7240833.1 metal-dependent hydrolase [Amaricoccus sp.]
MKLTWLGHSGFRIEIADQVLLVDPWLKGNPMFPAEREAEAVAGATRILLSHGHGDHAGDAARLAKAYRLPVAGIPELVHILGAEGVEGIDFNKGGTIRLGAVAVTMVSATHSSSFGSAGYAGGEAGYMIAGEGRTIYFSGDTDVTADMGVFEALHHPEIGILCAGGHYTMDMARAAYAARTFFNFRTVIPCHYRTFPLLEQSAEALKAGLPGVEVIEPEVMVPIEI